MDFLLALLGLICIILGVAGSIIPGLPGPPLSYLGILLIHWTKSAQFSNKMLIIWAVIVIVVTIIDLVVPVWGTKKFGGTKAGVRGSTIGLIIGVILLPMLGIVLGPFGLFGILGGPFIGAWIAERLSGQNNRQAIHAAIGSFIGFVAGTFMKLAVAVVLGFYYIKGFIQLL